MGVESRIRPYYLYHWHGTGTGTTPLFLKGLAWSVWWFNFVMMKFKRLNLYSIYIAVENYSVKFVYCQVHTHTVDRLGELDFKTGLDGTHFYFIVLYAPARILNSTDYHSYCKLILLAIGFSCNYLLILAVFNVSIDLSEIIIKLS